MLYQLSLFDDRMVDKALLIGAIGKLDKYNVSCEYLSTQPILIHPNV